MTLLAVLALPLFFSGCENDEDAAELQMLGALADATNLPIAGYFFFQGTVDLDRTASCGSASPSGSSSSGSTESGSGSSSGSGSGSTTNTSKYDISSFWYFKTGEGTFSYNTGTMTLRFIYNENKQSYTLNPVDSASSTCFTADGINCNGSSDNGNPTCVTVDNVKCGGEQAFIYTNEDPEFTFQANNGTLEYDRGFNLDDTNENVSLAKIDFSMVASDGTIFQGNANCLSQEQ